MKKTTKTDFVSNGEKIKVIHKKSDNIEWWKAIPMPDGILSSIHIGIKSNQTNWAHIDLYEDSRTVAKRHDDFLIDSLIAGPKPSVIKSSEPIFFIPKDSHIETLNIQRDADSVKISTDQSGYLLYATKNGNNFYFH